LEGRKQVIKAAAMSCPPLVLLTLKQVLLMVTAAALLL
jgi:hypothetical protein